MCLPGAVLVLVSSDGWYCFLRYWIGIGCVFAWYWYHLMDGIVYRGIGLVLVVCLPGGCSGGKLDEV